MTTPIKQSLDKEIETRDRKVQKIWDISVSTLISRLKTEDTIELDYDLSCFDLSLAGIVCDNMFSFLTHYRLVEKAELDYPIIIAHDWRVLDWRHRICKAILQGKRTIKAIKFVKDQNINFD